MTGAGLDMTTGALTWGEILDEREMEVFASEDSGAELWRAYRTVAEGWGNFATKRIAKPADIFPVFHELFKKSEAVE